MWWMWTGVGASAAVALWWWLRRVIVVVAVRGPSMEPSFPDGSTVLVRRAGSARPGQVVVLAPAEQGPPTGRPGRLWLIKRVAAVAGDTVGAGCGPALRQGEPVPDRHLVVLGDNASESVDSREEGFVPVERLRGIVLARIS